MTNANAAGDATRLRLIEAAELLVAARGVDCVSVRDITNAAGANPASVHYHFRSKEGLLRAVLEYRSQLMRGRRESYLREFDSGTPDIEQLVRAMVRPTFDLAENGDAAAYVGFIAALVDHGSMVPVVQEYFGDQFGAYVDLVHEACPELSPGTVINRLSFGLFLVFNAASRPARGLGTWISNHRRDSLDRLETDLVRFITGGLASPGACSAQAPRGST